MPLAADTGSVATMLTVSVIIRTALILSVVANANATLLRAPNLQEATEVTPHRQAVALQSSIDFSREGTFPPVRNVEPFLNRRGRELAERAIIRCCRSGAIKSSRERRQGACLTDARLEAQRTVRKRVREADWESMRGIFFAAYDTSVSMFARKLKESQMTRSSCACH